MQEKVSIDKIKGDESNSTIYIMSLYVGDLDLYEKAKLTKRFIDRETKVLEQVLETDLRNFLRQNGVLPYDGSNQALEKAFAQLEIKGKSVEIRDRYYEIEGENIIGESPNHMTVIEENGLLSCAMEVVIHDR